MKVTNIILGSGLAVAVVAGIALMLKPQKSHDILLSNATASMIEDSAGSVGVFLKIENSGGPDRLIDVDSGQAASARFSQPGPIPVPANSAPGLASDGVFVRLDGVVADLKDGLTLPVTLTFESAGEMSLRARVAAPKQVGQAANYGLFGIGDICQVGEGEPAPEISLSVTQDKGGWRVQVISNEFDFTPDLVDGPHVPGTGHGHLYLNGLKLQRLYESEAHIGQLPTGSHEIRVTLNTNDHRAYVIGDDPVTASARITVD